jgi:hypothetical protein
MKITKQRLKEIIKEELQNLNEVDRGQWVIERDGVTSDEKYLTRGLKWGPQDSADVHEFKQEAEGVLRAALEMGKIDSGRVTDMAVVDDADEEALHLKGDPSQRETDRLRRKLKYGFEDWRK